MAGGQEKWYFTKEQLQNSPSRKCGLDADKELAYRQQAANLIQDMGQRLQVSQLCINTAIVYMHRFYAFHSFTQFHRNAIAAAALFLAAKVEEQPRKLEYVIKVAHVCLYRGDGSNNVLLPEHYQEQAQDLVFNENVLLQTLGFDVAIDHPHTHVVRTCHLVKAPKDLAQTSYFMASNSLHLTTMCLQYRPTVVACFCIHLASKWSNWAIPQSNEGRHWFSYVDRSVTSELLEKLTAEFLHIFDKCPSRLKRKMKTMTSTSGGSPHSGASSSALTNSPFDKKHAPSVADDFDKSFDKDYERERRRQPMPGGYVPASAPAAPQASAPQPPQPPPPQKIDYNLYREKREREERERRDERERRQMATIHQAARGTGSLPRHKPGAHAKPHAKPHAAPAHAPNRHHRPLPLIGQPPSSSTSSSSASLPSSAPHPLPTEVRTRPPSLFSPETVPTATPAPLTSVPNVASASTSAQRRHHPPPIHQHRHRPENRPQMAEKPPSPKKRPDPSAAIREMQLPPTLSPFSSPSAENKPALVPVLKKIDETPGYENVVRDSQRGVKTKVPERKPEQIRPLNGIETDPRLVSNLLKESLAKPAPITVATEKKSPIVEVKKEPLIEAPPVVQAPIEPPVVIEDSSEHKHKKEKKKKEKHKHKDRDKSKEERKKHKKDKEREKKKEPSPPEAPAETNDGTLRITIPRDKLATSPAGLKIKIPKERLAAPPPPPSGLKIKISKEILETSRKRTGPPEPAGPPHKMQRQNGNHHKVEPTLGNGHAGK